MEYVEALPFKSLRSALNEYMDNPDEQANQISTESEFDKIIELIEQNKKIQQSAI